MTQKSSISRRGFLGRAASAAAAVAAPSIIPASARGADGFTAPSNRIMVAGIGMGIQNRGHWHNILNYSGMPVQAVACCDVESKRREARAAQAEARYADLLGKGSYKGCKVYGDFREMLARDDIDAVFIATPDHWHAINVVEACKAGKDVFCEKPLSLTIRDGQEMARAVRRYGRVFQTGSMQRSSHSFQFGCEMARSGRIGRIHTVHVNVGGPSVECDLPPEPTLDTLDWDMWLGPAPRRPYNAILCPDHTNSYPNWRRYRDYSGGGMTDWGAHHFDIAQWGLGMDDSGPVEIIPPNGKDVERLTYVYDNGVVMYHGGAQGSAGVEFIGDKGRILVNRGYLETIPADIMREPIRPDEVHLYHSREHMLDWVHCIHSRSDPICPVEVGLRSVTVCHLGNIAYWTGRPIRWDPVKQDIVGDNDDARRWLSRPCREPWSC